MLNQPENNDQPVPTINFQEIIKFQKRSSSAVERQVTVSRYRTYSPFSLDKVLNALKKCAIKASDDFGVIRVRTSLDSVPTDDPAENPEHIKLDVGDKWARALFAVIGEKYFRWLDFETKDIFEYMIAGALDETFLVEYYRDAQNELRFLTYGGSRYSERITSKHRLGFGRHFVAVPEEFSHDFIRQVCSRPQFIHNLKKISYDPEGEAGYGTVQTALLKTKYANVIDPDASRVKEILDNPKILISDFGSKFAMFSPFVTDTLNIRFDISVNGQVTLYLPELKFPKPVTDFDKEDIFYEIARSAYATIIDNAPQVSDQFHFTPSNGQLVIDFLKGIDE